jgi:tRNA (cmo5U34)-methyltransferase
MLAERVSPRRICLMDASAEMLAQAKNSLASWEIETRVQELSSPLPSGPFHAVVSALAIHHLTDPEKRELLARIYDVLVPGGILVNAEQILGPTPWHQHLYETTHLEAARALGSSEEEIAGAERRMSYDRCSPLNSQLAWLREIGYERVDVFFQWFRFAVYAGWKSED